MKTKSTLLIVFLLSAGTTAYLYRHALEEQTEEILGTRFNEDEENNTSIHKLGQPLELPRIDHPKQFFTLNEVDESNPDAYAIEIFNMDLLVNPIEGEILNIPIGPDTSLNVTVYQVSTQGNEHKTWSANYTKNGTDFPTVFTIGPETIIASASNGQGLYDYKINRRTGKGKLVKTPPRIIDKRTLDQ